MKNLKTVLIIAALIMAATAATAQSKYRGKVITNEPYEVYIVHIPKEGKPYWVRWELWEFYEEYRVVVEPFNRIEAVWVSQCTRDTIARAFFNGERSGSKQEQDIYFQNDTLYEFGTWPFHRPVSDQVYNDSQIFKNED